MYTTKAGYFGTSPKARSKAHATIGKTSACLIWFCTAFLIIFAGVAYRVLASKLAYVIGSPVELPIPLSDFPMKVGNWVGEPLLIPSTTIDYMRGHFADDFLSRRYTNIVNDAWVDVYVVYSSSQPGGILGHQPLICYPAHGWICNSTEQSQFRLLTGQQIPCLIHRFHRSSPWHDQTIVLNLYIVNGQITTNDNLFSGPLGRRPNIAGDPARYVAQVQISSVLESSIREAAKDITNAIFDFLPDKDGLVKATQYSNVQGGALR